MIAKPKTKPPAKDASAAPTPAELDAARLAPPKSPAQAEPSKPARAKRLFGKRPVDRLERLQAAIRQVQSGRHDSPRTARLLAAGAPKLAQKLVEEAAEVAIEAVRGDYAALINESVDLLYNLTALWTGLDVDLAAVWAEMDRREATLGMAEKLPKTEDI